MYNNEGTAIYPVKNIEEDKNNEFEVGAEVSLIAGATYISGNKIPDWIRGYKMYVREIRYDNNIIISTNKTGAITGVVHPS